MNELVQGAEVNATVAQTLIRGSGDLPHYGDAARESCLDLLAEVRLECGSKFLPEGSLQPVSTPCIQIAHGINTCNCLLHAFGNLCFTSNGPDEADKLPGHGRDRDLAAFLPGAGKSFVSSVKS